MRFSVSGQSCRHANVLLMLVGVISMLLMPVDYRGGAAVPHPHATVQLIADLAGGSLDHHGEARAGHLHPATRLAGSPLGPLNEGLAPDLVHDAGTWSSIAHSAASIATLTALAGDDLILAPPVDAEKPTPWSAITGKYLLYALVLPPLMLLAWNLGQGHFDRRKFPAWQGVSSPPEPPPPRRNGCHAPLTPLSDAG